MLQYLHLTWLLEMYERPQLWDISMAVNRQAYAAFKGALTLDCHLICDGDNMAIGLAYATTQTFV